MKKQIPEKVANKVYDKLLAGKRLERSKLRSWSNNWREELFYKPDTNKISNKFFKNKVTNFTYKCKCNWCLDGKLNSTRKRWESTQEQLNDYI